LRVASISGAASDSVSLISDLQFGHVIVGSLMSQGTRYFVGTKLGAKAGECANWRPDQNPPSGPGDDRFGLTRTAISRLEQFRFVFARLTLLTA
jgi:hypothetical protein